MTRINIRADGKFAGWFDDENCLGSWAAGLETLYRTIGSRWVLRGRDGEYRFVTPELAHAWLTERELADEAEAVFAVLPRGRPLIGGEVKVRLGAALADVDALAARHRMSRADAVRHLVELGLKAEGRTA